MGKSKKLISLLLLTAAAAVVLTGCGPSEGSAPTSSSWEASPSSEASTPSQTEPLSQEWKSINELEEYRGMLDSPITQITLSDPADNPYHWVTFSDEDLMQIWSEYLNGLELQEYDRYSQEDQNQLVGTPPPNVTVTTETGEYTLYFCLGTSEINRTGVEGEETLEYREWEDGNYRLQSQGIFYTLSDPEGFPFDQTYEIAAQRHGEESP